jgi:hypothetical protein
MASGEVLMITTAIIDLINTVIAGFDSLFPSFSLPSYFSGGSLIPSGVVNFFAAAFNTISPFFPSALFLAVLVALADLWPIVLAWIVANWVYNHIPTIAGFGVGN